MLNIKLMNKLIKEYGYYAAFLIAFVATLGSLFLSEVLHFPPCVLCWYQRVCMYPLVIILGVGIWRKDKQAYLYALPIVIIGTLISIYHNLLYYNILPESVAPCVNGVSCTTKFINVFGFVDIPLLSLIGFVIITTLLLRIRKGEIHDKRR